MSAPTTSNADTPSPHLFRHDHFLPVAYIAHVDLLYAVPVFLPVIKVRAHFFCVCRVYPVCDAPDVVSVGQCVGVWEDVPVLRSDEGDDASGRFWCAAVVMRAL